MSDPIPPPSGPPSDPSSGQQPPSPFDSPIGPGERQLPPTRPGGSGARKPLLIGCGVILLLVVGVMAYFLTHPEVLVVWTLEAIHSDLEGKLPEDLPDDLRARYEDAYERAIASAREDPLTPETLESLQRVQREFTAAVQGGGARLSVEEVERITEAMEALSGGAAPSSDPAPEAEPPIEADTEAEAELEAVPDPED